MVVVGMWLAIVGYGLVYAGAIKLGGGTCSFLDGMQGKCQPASARTQSSVTGGTGVTLLQAQQAAQAQQAGMIGAQPISQVA